MKPVIRILFLFSLTALLAHSQEVRIAVGTPTRDALTLIKQQGGIDITGGLALLPTKDGLAPKEVFWEFGSYDAVIALDSAAETVVRLSYWSKSDFGESLDHRSKTEQSISALYLDIKTKRVRIDKVK
jgi:hypothetical protein